jgi:hypothetical protein
MTDRLFGTEAVRKYVQIARNRPLVENEIEWAMCRLHVIDVVTCMAYAEIERLKARVTELENAVRFHRNVWEGSGESMEIADQRLWSEL